MPTREEQLVRLRVARDSGKAPRDLMDWVLCQLEPRPIRAREIQRALQAAADATEAPSRTKRAKMLAEIVSRFHEYPGLLAVAWYPPGSPEAIVQSIMRVESVPSSLRQLLRRVA